MVQLEQTEAISGICFQYPFCDSNTIGKVQAIILKSEFAVCIQGHIDKVSLSKPPQYSQTLPLFKCFSTSHSVLVIVKLKNHREMPLYKPCKRIFMAW